MPKNIFVLHFFSHIPSHTKNAMKEYHSLQACFKHDMVVGQDENIVEKSHHVITVKLKKVRAAEVVLLADMT